MAHDDPSETDATTTEVQIAADDDQPFRVRVSDAHVAIIANAIDTGMQHLLMVACRNAMLAGRRVLGDEDVEGALAAFEELLAFL